MILLFTLSLFGLGVIDVMAEMKSYFKFIDILYGILVVAISVSLSVFVYSKTKSTLKAISVGLILLLIIFGYPALTSYLDTQRAKNDPGSVYFEG